MQWRELFLKQIHKETFYEERRKVHCYNKSVGSKNLVWLIFSYICYNAGGSTKHSRRSKVKRRDEDLNSQTSGFLATVSSVFVVNSASQQESVASFVGNQIKAKEDHLMRLYMLFRYFLQLFARLQTLDINGMSPNPITWRWKFFLLAEKKEIFCSRMWACIFRLKWCTVGIHNAMARTGLETNSSGDACCLWYRISLSADENMKTNRWNKCISEKWKTYAFFVFQSHCCEKALSKRLR